MSDLLVRTAMMMDTAVTLKIVGHGDTSAERAEGSEALDRAMGWFGEIERRCTRFDPSSELRQLCAHPGAPVTVSGLLLELLRFALALAEETGGAFDPTVGGRMETRGFDREFRTGVRSPAAVTSADASYRDVSLDAAEMTVTLHRPLVLDLGAVAKGFAIDLAARELEPFERFAIDAGGDLFLRGTNERNEMWTVGIRHPRLDGEIIETLRVSDVAVCTSGDYERRGPGGEHHIVTPGSAGAPSHVASATVIAPLAMVADGLATAAFVLGADAGMALIERHGARGILFTDALERVTTTTGTA